MKKNQYWESVNSTRWWQPLVFFALIAAGVVAYLLYDSFVIKAASAQLASWWLNLSGFPASRVELAFPRVYLAPLGDLGIRWRINSTNTPSAGLFPFMCLVVIPKTRWQARLRNYAIFASVLFLAVSIIFAVELREYHTGNETLLSNANLNQTLMYGLGAAALVAIFLLWPQSTIPFVYYPNLIANGIRALYKRGKDPGSRHLQHVEPGEQSP